MTTLDIDQLEVGMVLFYRGDEVPFVQAKHLITKGQKTGRWLLPAFQKNEAMPAGGAWVDIPGEKQDRYSIVAIERNRRSKKQQPLDDIVWIVGDGYRHIQFGLGYKDVGAKFGLLGRDPIAILGEDNVDGRIKAHITEKMNADTWLRSQQASSW